MRLWLLRAAKSTSGCFCNAIGSSEKRSLPYPKVRDLGAKKVRGSRVWEPWEVGGISAFLQSPLRWRVDFSTTTLQCGSSKSVVQTRTPSNWINWTVICSKQTLLDNRMSRNYMTKTSKYLFWSPRPSIRCGMNSPKGQGLARPCLGDRASHIAHEPRLRPMAGTRIWEYRLASGLRIGVLSFLLCSLG